MKSIHCKNFRVRNYHSKAIMQPFDAAYGTPSRMANSGMTATVFGAYGFVGRYITNNLGLPTQLILVFMF